MRDSANVILLDTNSNHSCIISFLISWTALPIVQ